MEINSGAKREFKNNYGRNKKSIKDEINILRNKLTDLYTHMFKELEEIFYGMNVIRWKDNIELYRTQLTFDAIECINNIFSFAPNIRTNLNDNTIIITETKYLSINVIWLLVLELHRTK